MNPKLSLVVPCYNEAATLETCIERVRAIASAGCSIEILIVDDASSDDSLARAHALAARHPEIRVLAHERNRGKGAALRTGFRHVRGDYVAVQDADLEYDPRDLIRLLEPLEAGTADVVLGSRFLASDGHRVLHFWHSAGNRFLTLLSNAFSDIHLSDIETCYKVFRRDVIQSIEIEEERFGFEPEIVAKLAALRLRIYEVGIHYDGRSYADGKKIRAIDGFRALYCIVRYNARQAPVGLVFLVYGAIGAICVLANLASFALLSAIGRSLVLALGLSYLVAALANYWLCRKLLFPLDAKRGARGEAARYAGIALLGMLIDGVLTARLIDAGGQPLVSKLLAILPFPVLNFLVRRHFVFAAPVRETAGLQAIR